LLINLKLEREKKRASKNNDSNSEDSNPKYQHVGNLMAKAQQEQPNIATIIQKKQNKPVLKKLLLTTFAMVLLPLIVYFVFFNYSQHFVAFTKQGNVIVATGASVIVVNMILAVFIYLAWQES